MKITKRTNHKGIELKKWLLDREDENTIILKDPETQAIKNVPRSTFENQMENEGASREGDVFYIPEVKRSKIR